MNLNKILKKSGIKREDFLKTGLKEFELLRIQRNFIETRKDLEPLARYIVKQLHNSDKVHSIRYRIKDADNLIAKIIRKKIQNPSRIINIRNYKKEITDLIGVRVLHLFKNDWKHIHEFIKSNWIFYQNKKPIVYYREGDSVKMIKSFEKKECLVKEHPFGYRSVHYLIESRPGKEPHIAELQVRTIFEEAWSEIDHTVRYPNQIKNPLLEQYLVMFNGLVGSADEMGSYVVHLKNELLKLHKKNAEDRREKSKIINLLRNKINNLEMKPEEVKDIEGKLDGLMNVPILDPYSVWMRSKGSKKVDKVDYELMDTLLQEEENMNKDELLETTLKAENNESLANLDINEIKKKGKNKEKQKNKK
ncbi:MAG: hypothetical protein GF347_02690 [Candidatus Moranbacteria bacterium]|nr:hypothetical protein [Candidatus Moranbacteria bacterium]